MYVKGSHRDHFARQEKKKENLFICGLRKMRGLLQC